MGFLDVLSGIGKVAKAPFELIGDFVREPLRGAEHNRQLRQNEQQFELSEQARDRDLQRKIQEEENRVNLAIKQETEVAKIVMEIEQLRKDKEFARMKAVSEAIVQYQEKLTKINVDAINAIGSMQLELRNKAYDLIAERTKKCKEFQDEVMYEAVKDYQMIEEKFSNNEAAKAVLMNAVDMKLSGMIKSTNNFLDELNKDVSLISSSINLLAESGQKFIERHLEQFGKQTGYPLIQNDESDNIMYIEEAK